MAVVEVIEVWDGRKGKRGQTLREFNRVWIARTDSDDDAADTVLAHDDFPAEGDPYDDTQYSNDGGGPVCTEVAADQMEDGRFWKVTASYSTEGDDPTKNPDPLLRPPEFEWGEHEYKVAVAEDLAGNPIKNTYGDPFLPPVELPKSFDVLVVTKNEATYDRSLAALMRNTVNDAEWNGYAKNDVLLKSIKGKRKWENGKHYWANTYTFWFRDRETEGKGAWFLHLLNYGLRGFDADSGNERVATASGHRTKGFLLDIDGIIIDDPGPDDAVYLDFDVYDETDFSFLDITLP